MEEAIPHHHTDENENAKHMEGRRRGKVYEELGVNEEAAPISKESAKTSITPIKSNEHEDEVATKRK